MSANKQNALVNAQNTYKGTNKNTWGHHSIKAPTKAETLLLALLNHPQEGLYALDVNQPNNKTGFFSTCLHSDISNLRRTSNIEIEAIPYKVKFKQGHTADFKRYRLINKNADKNTCLLLNKMREQRKASLLTKAEIKAFTAPFPN